ncbi:MAG TPA: hypothetical protein VMF57_03875 [Solirubrobacteraceae bacterium]|nr:hypothetical protein [Solirubrobacteraceae bacterium]
MRHTAVVAAVAVALVVAGTAVAVAGQEPVLAGPWSMGQQGYGHVKPRRIFNGGDPSGLVKVIRWSSWGGARATGTGMALYVGPHQITAAGKFEKAHVVLFQLGTCDGRSAYDAIEWYFTQHRQKFSPGTYINACTGTYYMNGHAEQ